MSPSRAALIACCGSTNREIEATSRASASRSTVSARPDVVDHLRRGHPGDRWRSLCANCRYDTVDPSRLRRFPQVHPYTVSTYPQVQSVTRLYSCAYRNWRFRRHRKAPTSTIAPCYPEMCLRTPEVWSGLGLHTPANVHYGLAETVRDKRAGVLDAAYTAQKRDHQRSVSAPCRPRTSAIARARNSAG